MQVLILAIFMRGKHVVEEAVPVPLPGLVVDQFTISRLCIGSGRLLYDLKLP